MLSNNQHSIFTCSKRKNALRCDVKPKAWVKTVSLKTLRESGSKKTVDLGKKSILIAESEGSIFAVENKCSHLGIPLVGKAKFLEGKVSGKCVTCVAHGTSFNLEDGKVKGEWCPKIPNLPVIGKGSTQKPIGTFQCRVTDEGYVEVDL